MLTTVTGLARLPLLAKVRIIVGIEYDVLLQYDYVDEFGKRN
jgi:hypothetical protein